MKLCTFLQFLTTVILLSRGTYAKYIRQDLDDEPFSDVGRPSTSTESEGKCHKDILILLDTSKSIDEKNFDTQVKPFLRDFVADKKLNVGPDGTQVALLLFSKYSDPNSPYYKKENDKTKLVIPFSLNYDAEMFERYVEKMDYKQLEGGHTRTDKAFEMANDVFPEDSPLNNRKGASDVVIIITDGRPTGTNTVEQDAITFAEKLKKKGVLIIGVGVGNNIENPEFWSILQKVVSPGQAMRVKFDKFQSIRDTLVKSSCKNNNFSPGVSCHCPKIQSAPIYLKPGETSKKLSWERPDPVCPGVSETVRILDFTSEPPLQSPATFEAGQHSIEYKFYLSGNQQLNCAVKFDVRACECPQEELDDVPVKPGDTRVDLEYRVPVPTCLHCPSPLTTQSLSVGQHSMTYEYNIGNQFNMSCKVAIEVKGTLCKGDGYDPSSQECCCGVIHDKKPGHECCGQNLFNISTHQCCDGDNIRKKGEECPTKN